MKRSTRIALFLLLLIVCGASIKNVSVPKFFLDRKVSAAPQFSQLTGAVMINSAFQGPFTGTNGRIKLSDQGQCTMAAGTCSAQTATTNYTLAPIALITWTGTGTCTGVLKAAVALGPPTTVTPSSSAGADTCQVNWALFGN